MAGEDIIDESVVRIRPDLSKFNEELKAKLKKETRGVEAKVKIVADYKGWAGSVDDALKAHARRYGPRTAKVKLVADAKGWATSVEKALAGEKTPTVKLGTDKKSTEKVAKDVAGVFKKIEGSSLVLADTIDRRINKSIKNSFLLTDRAEPLTKALSLRRQALAAIETAERESNRRIEREQKRSVAARKAAISPLLKAAEANGIIDLGGKGIRPSNIPIAALIALSPALLAIASSAGLAATSIAAIGTASIGAVLGITSLVVGFSRIREVLALREQVRKEEARSTASTAENAAAERSRARAVSAGARAVRDSLRGLADARRGAREADQAAVEARKAVNDAYREAAVFVRDLREELADLALQERQDALDVAGAKERLASVNNNYWATDLEKRQAALDVQKALNSQSDTKRERVTKRKQLNKLDREGLGQSEQVLEARKRATEADRAAVDAQRNVVRAQEQVADAHAQAAEAKLADAAASTKVSAASQDLAAQIAKLSPAARDMYYWFERNQGMLDKLRGKMEQAVLPGFLTFLKAVTDRGRRGKGTSTLDILADGAARLGSIIGKTIGRLGEMSKLPWFRKGLKKINAENEKSFTLLGEAALTLVKPLHQIIVAAAPLFTKFSRWLLDLSEKFAAFIDKSAKDGSLIQWFKDAGEEAGKWWRILKNVLGFLKSVFSASLPTGKDLVTRLGDLTEKLNEWAKSPKGQDRIEKFFKFFKDIDYEKLRNFVIQLGILVATAKLFTFGRKHPIVSLVLLLASSDMELAAKLMDGVSTGMGKLILWAEKHPVAAAAILAILTAAKNQKSATISLKLLGLGGIADKIAKVFGRATTATMYVTAGVVNVAGKGGLPGGLPGAPPPKPGATKTVPKVVPKPGFKGGLGGGGKAAAAAAVAAAVVANGELPKDPETWLKLLFGGIQRNVPRKTIKQHMEEQQNERRRKGEEPWPSFNVPMRSGASSNVPAPGSPVQRAAAIKKEADAFVLLNRCVTDATQRIIANSEASADNNANLQNYVRTRRESVDATVAHIRETRGEQAAQRELAKQNLASRDTLATVLTQMGWNAEAAKDYAEKIIAIPEQRETEVKLPGVKAREEELKKVNEQIEALIGPKTAVISILPGSDADKQLEKLVVQQMALSKGWDLKQAQNLYDKQERLSKFASGGRVPGVSPHPRADNIPAMLTANEYVHPVDAVKYYGTGTMDAIRQRRIPREALNGYALGGAVAPGVNAITDRWPFGVKLPEPNVEDFGFAGALGSKGGLGSWQSLWRTVKGAFGKGVSLFSAFRRGSRTLSGNLSRHAVGRAIDITPDRRIATWIMQNFGKSTRELITPWRDRMLLHGRPHKYSHAIEAQHGVFGHNRHIHWAMADGGLVNPLPKRFDTGGRLDPGYTLAYNGTGATETVRTAMQEKNLNEPRRIDKRDLVLLAQYIASASAQPIVMDGRKVAEIVYGYGYLPGGV